MSKLNETAFKALTEAYNSYSHKTMEPQSLCEWIDGEGMGNSLPISESNIEEVVKIVQNEEKYLAESNFSVNVTPFTKKIQPLLRRIIPKYMGFEIAGVQPVDSTSSEIFMVKAQYAGNSTELADKDTSVIIEATQGGTAQPVAKGNTITTDNGAQGTVVYTEPDYTKIVVNVTSGTFVAGGLFDVGGTYTAGANDITIDGVYSNEASFKQILPGYSGPYTTAQGEVLGTEMNQLRVTIVSQPVTVKTRKLKAELTLELIQDMKKMHGASADKEIMFFLETEIVNDMNMEIINDYKNIATALPNFAVATTNNSQGRWSKEMYSGLYDRILKDKIDLSDRNRRGQGNVVIATSGVITALMSLGKFVDITNVSNAKPAQNHSTNFVGTLADGTKVYQDWFATSGQEYYMTIYKGAGNLDNGIIYSPYHMLEMLQAQNPQTLQPILGLYTRYGLTVNNLLSDGGSDYCSLRIVDFVNTPLV